jgi:hypothetical protein
MVSGGQVCHEVGMLWVPDTTAATVVTADGGTSINFLKAFLCVRHTSGGTRGMMPRTLQKNP